MQIDAAYAELCCIDSMKSKTEISTALTSTPLSQSKNRANISTATSTSLDMEKDLETINKENKENRSMPMTLLRGLRV